MTGERVETASEEAGHDEVDEWPDAESLDKEVVENELDGDIDEVPDSKLLTTNEAWTESIEKYLERAKEERRARR